MEFVSPAPNKSLKVIKTKYHGTVGLGFNSNHAKKTQKTIRMWIEIHFSQFEWITKFKVSDTGLYGNLDDRLKLIFNKNYFKIIGIKTI